MTEKLPQDTRACLEGAGRSIFQHHRRLMPFRLIYCLFLVLAIAPMAAGQSRSATSPLVPVRLVEILGPEILATDAVGHFRARVASAASQPVNYLWDLGDGTLSVGALVSHVYRRPGSYELTVVAQTGAGGDTLRTLVTVVPALVADGSVDSGDPIPEPSGAPISDTGPDEPPSPAPQVTLARSALFGAGGVSPAQGGYTWVIRNDLWAERAQHRLLSYRLRGLRADVYVDTTGAGSPAHRIVVGQFSTVEEALAARAWLPSEAPPSWLLELGPPKSFE